MATTLALSADALALARRGDLDRLAGEVGDAATTPAPGSDPGSDRGPVGDRVEDLVGALATTRTVARCLLASPDGLRRLDLHAGDGVALLLDGDGGDPAMRSRGLVSGHLDALVHLVVESVGLQWRPRPVPAAFTVGDPTDVPAAVLDYPGSVLAGRLPPSVDPTRVRWWSMQFPDEGSALADELTVLDADRAGLFRQDGTDLRPTTSARTWAALWAVLWS